MAGRSNIAQKTVVFWIRVMQVLKDNLALIIVLFFKASLSFDETSFPVVKH